MKRKNSESSNSDDRRKSSEVVENIRTKPSHIFDNLTRRLIQLGITLAITTFIGLIVRYAVHEFDPSTSMITVQNNRDVASFSVSKHFLERILEFIEESIAIVAAVIPLGFPLCTIFNRYLARMRAGSERMDIRNDKVLSAIPKYVVIGDILACQMPNTNRLRPLVRDTIYQLIKAHLKPKLILEDAHDEARKFGIRIGLIRRDHHKLAVIKSVDLLKNITDSRGDIEPAKVRYLLSRMKIMSQATPADKSLLIYLMKHCESRPNENLLYLGYSFTDPEAMRIADCALTYSDCDDDDVKQAAQVLIKSESTTFTDLYLFAIVCLLSSNIIQSYALYQVSASVSSCIYRFLSITVFQEQIISYSQFALLMLIQQVFAVIALLTKWLSSLPRAPMHPKVAEMSHSATEDGMAAGSSAFELADSQHRSRSRSRVGHNDTESSSTLRRDNQPTSIKVIESDLTGSSDDTLGSSSSLNSTSHRKHRHGRKSSGLNTPESNGRVHRRKRRRTASESSRSRIHLSGIDFNSAIINSKLVTKYKQTFNSNSLVDDVTYRLIKLHIAYQALVMVIVMIFGNTMFQLNSNNNRQHQTLALNSLMMNNIFNLANCFNQVGGLNIKSGFKNHPFFVCILLFATFLQWFVCFVFAALSALIAPLTGQQQRNRQRAEDSKSALSSQEYQLVEHLRATQAHSVEDSHRSTPRSRSSVGRSADMRL